VASPFEVLGVPPDADEERIRQAFRQRVKETHPDQGGSAAAFQRVKDAYEELEEGYDPDEYIDLDGETDPEAEPVDDEPETTEVEYLNYEVLDDHGWSLDDDDLFAKAAAANLEPDDYGTFTAGQEDPLLETAEDHGFTWPYSCRGGACANCAVTVCAGGLDMPVSHILPGEMTDRGIQLSCVGTPQGEDLQVVFNVKHLPDLEELRLPPGPFKNVQLND
jgi:curved DNA-binding protein CbpA